MDILICKKSSFCVARYGEYSVIFYNDLGTPQGRILGLLLFLFDVHDMPEYLKLDEIFIYASGTTILVYDAQMEKSRKLNLLILLTQSKRLNFLVL